MIADRIENLDTYPLLAPYAGEVQAFIARVKNEALPEGKYELCGEQLFALVQAYETKPLEGARMESHRIYGDIQYVESGVEAIYYDCVQDLMICEDRTPENDIVFYEARPNKGCTVLSAGMFAFYGPQDAHMPCITCDGQSAVKKIVFKVKLK